MQLACSLRKAFVQVGSRLQLITTQWWTICTLVKLRHVRECRQHQFVLDHSAKAAIRLFEDMFTQPDGEDELELQVAKKRKVSIRIC